MAQTYVTDKYVTLRSKLTAAWTSFTWDVDLWIDAWRLKLVRWSQVEWISFTSVTPNWSYFTYWWLTRGLSQIADPATPWTGKIWVSWTKAYLVAMHDQLIDKQQDWTQKSGTKIQLWGSSAYVYSDDNWTTLKFKDWSTTEQTLSGLASWAWTDHKVAVSSWDTTPDYLVNKMTISNWLISQIDNFWLDETFDIQIDLTDSWVFVSTSSWAWDSGKVPLLNASGKIDAFVSSSFWMTWEIRLWSTKTIPSWWLTCDWSNVSRTTYATLFWLLNPSLWTFTITIASPWVATLSSHWLQTWDSIYFTTTWALPTWLSANTRYWAIRVDANTFRVATTLANALAWTAINTSWSQSWVHTARLTPYWLWDWSTTFTLPDLRWRIPGWLDTTQTEFAWLGQTWWAKTHTLTLSETPSNVKTYSNTGPWTGNWNLVTRDWAGVGNVEIWWSWGAHNNLQPYIVLNYIIKT